MADRGDDPMGLTGRGHDGPAVRRYQMKEKLISIGGDSWIENESGDKVYQIDGKAMRIRETFILKDTSVNDVAKIQERKLSIQGKVKIEFGESTATAHKALVGLHYRFNFDLDNGPDIKAHGNFVDHEYEIERDGDHRDDLQDVVPGARHRQHRKRSRSERRAAACRHGLHQRHDLAWDQPRDKSRSGCTHTADRLTRHRKYRAGLSPRRATPPDRRHARSHRAEPPRREAISARRDRPA